MEWIFYTLIAVVAIALRVTYIQLLFDDWNHWLNSYIKKCVNQEDLPDNRLEYLKGAHLEVGKHWWKLSRWRIKDFISNELLIDDVSGFNRAKYRNFK